MHQDKPRKLIIVCADSVALAYAKARLSELTEKLGEFELALSESVEEFQRFFDGAPELSPRQVGYTGYSTYSRPVNPPKHSKKSRRGHNKAQDRVFGKAGYC